MSVSSQTIQRVLQRGSGSAPSLKFLGKQLVYASASLDEQSNRITSSNSIAAFW